MDTFGTPAALLPPTGTVTSGPLPEIRIEDQQVAELYRKRTRAGATVTCTWYASRFWRRVFGPTRWSIFVSIQNARRASSAPDPDDDSPSASRKPRPERPPVLTAKQIGDDAGVSERTVHNFLAWWRVGPDKDRGPRERLAWLALRQYIRAMIPADAWHGTGSAPYEFHVLLDDVLHPSHALGLELELGPAYAGQKALLLWHDGGIAEEISLQILEAWAAGIDPRKGAAQGCSTRVQNLEACSRVQELEACTPGESPSLQDLHPYAGPPIPPHESAAAEREAAAEGGTSARTTAELEVPPLAHPLPDADAAAEGTPLGELLSLGTPKRLALSWVNHPWSESGPVALACVQEYPRIAERKAAEGDPIESKWGYLRAIVAARLEARDPSPPVAHRRKAAAAANPAGSAAERRAFEKLSPDEQARRSLAELHARKNRDA